MDHRAYHLFTTLRARKLIGIREKITFQRFYFWSEIGDQVRARLRSLQKILGRSQPGVLHRLGDVEHGIAFRDGDYMEVNIPARNAIEDLRNTRPAVK